MKIILRMFRKMGKEVDELMSELFSLVKTILTVVGEWGREHPVQLALNAGITLGGAVLLVIAMSGMFDFSVKSLPEESAPESVVIVPVLSTPTLELTVQPTEELPEIDVAFVATIELASCESDSCEVPVWQTHERTILIGTIPEGDTVDVISCFYPLVEQESPEDDELEINTYTIEGLWCETYYLNFEGDVIKGVTQYWNLLAIEVEGSDDAQPTPE